ncbi:probable histone-lysine N-methyltransferase CG1716 [Ceratitis capitata]|uniref:probable histone-lysine N-methyltransferase CG1716 n=1 Tax=Ceratitis capitata TaxID=7213 RepID=UPI000329F426|nr:probable histone-lysine N-methyltransferase CG1716 [Ceratitis capitata]XP_020717313.1 probable histone-lysine N-methyltransferase CG1716 [Ceratitis capitata]XP_020717314.1 probable histone-lysine N-methyltransferase CG1716 [Ceratitis capitata]
MDSPPSISEGTPQRKRLGRPPKATQTKPSTEGTEVSEEVSVQKTSDLVDSTESPVRRMENENLMEIDGAVLAISPSTLSNVAANAGNTRVATAATSSECRRSSRKKIIKFDVRDLLNKHRKPHKIQIEARIDSNVPQTQKSTVTAPMGAAISNDGAAVLSSTTDLSSKQKAFMEKSAIFRRISISEQQNKINAPPLPPPLTSMPKICVLGKSPINLKSNVDTLVSMDPAKIAQARRLSRTQEIFNASLMKSKQNSSLIVAQIESNTSGSSSVLMSSTPPQQKKVTNVSNKRKSTTNAFVLPTTTADAKSSPNEFGVQKRRGRPPKNKIATVAQNPSTKSNLKSAIKLTTTIDKYTPDQQNPPTEKYTNKKPEDKEISSKATTNVATNWKEYKANLNRTCHFSSSSESLTSFTQKPQAHTDDVILEISSTSSVSEHEFQTVATPSTTDVHESQQRNFASVCILQESPSICETISAPEFIVAAVEEITTENVSTDKSISLETSTDGNLQKPVVLDLVKIVESNSERNIKTADIRKSSGSESESGSERSNKSYKSGDKLRVSLKRLAMPQCGLSPSSASSSCSDVIASSSTANSNNNKNNSDDSSSPITTTSTELSKVTLSRNLPTRRSHRLPKKALDNNKVIEEECKTNFEINSNENINKTVLPLEIAENKAEKQSAQPFESNTLNAVKTVSEVVITKEENDNITSNTVENTNVELAATEQILDTEIAKPKICIQELPSVSNTSITIANEQQIAASYEELPSTSKRSKKGGITLPLKKQVGKFKMYEEALHNVAANVETSTLLDILNTVKQNNITLATKTVQNYVEPNSAESFSTTTDQLQSPTNVCEDANTPCEITAQKIDDVNKVLLPNEQIKTDEELTEAVDYQDELSCEKPTIDQLKHVQSFDENVGSIAEDIEIKSRTAQIEETKTKETLFKNITDLVEVKTDEKTINVCHEPAVVTDKPAQNVLKMSETTEMQNICNKPEQEHAFDESSSEEINSTTDSQSSRDELNKTSAKKTPSPSFSDSSSCKSSKKPTRRNERRSRRGETAGHKTLEETFAEIAAQSSKAVLELQARNELNEDVPENFAEMVLDDANISEQQVEIIENVHINENPTEVTLEDGSTKGIELQNEVIYTTELLECDVISNVENTVEVITCESTSETYQKDGSSRVQCSAPQVIILQEDTDSNSTNSSPSRRGRKGRSKRSPKHKSINATDALSENTQKTIETQVFKATNVRTTDSTIVGNISKATETSILEEEINELQDQVYDTTESSTTVLENSNTTELSEVENVVEISTQEITTPAQDSFANVTEIGLVVEVTDIPYASSYTTTKTTQPTDSEISNISVDKSANISSPTVVETKERKKSTPTKTRKPKRSTNAKAQKSAEGELDEKVFEPLKDSVQNVSTEPEESFEITVENAMETNIDSIRSTSLNLSLTNNDSIVESKCSTEISNNTTVQNVPVLEEGQQYATPIEKPKKVRKRKSTKQLSEEKIVDTKPETPTETKIPSKSSEEQPIEAKGQTSYAVEDVAKKRKSKAANETSTGDLSAEVSDEVSDSSALEAVEKELLSKAPPKKRLLKMQMELEDKSNTSTMELPSTSTANVDANPATARKSTTDNGKSKDSAQKKSKKDIQTSDDLKDPATLESQVETAIEEESRSATTTPMGKRSKQKKGAEKTPEHKPKSGGKRKSKVDQVCGSNEKIDIKTADNKEKERSLSASKKSEKKKEFLVIEETASNELAKKLEEKSAKKKRQKKLKEAFEAALKDALDKPEASAAPIAESASTSESVVAMEEEKVKQPDPLPTAPTTISIEEKQIHATETAVEKLPETPAINEPEEEPDPLKDIEKFIEDGVNLLKRGYKIDDDSVDEVLCPKSLLQKEENKTDSVSKEDETIPPLVESMITPNESIAGDVTPVEKSFEEASNTLSQSIYYETPVDTPVATPTTTPPPKSPIQDSSIDEITGVRRSHRIKQITKTPKALVGRGLVREKERFSIKDDVEMKTHYSLDDHLTDLAQVEAKNAKFLKEMEERLSNFHVIKDNEYKCERVISREARKMLCDCFLTAEEEERGELGCGEDCLNRLLMIECGPDCNVKDRCTNKRFQKLLCSPCRVFRTEKKGFGIMADIEILPGEFIMEYVGEVIDGDEFEQRRTAYSLDKNRHYYFMALRSDAIIDATIKGNISRFINHSCDPNAETQKWTVNGELRIGFFSRKSIMPGEEITFDYQYQRYGREAQRCYCESANCRGWIGEEPNSDEGEQIDDDSDADNLADGSDEEDSDDSIEDAHKKAEAIANKSISVEEDGKVKDSAIKDKKKKLGEDTDEELKAKLKKLAGKSTDKAARRRKQNKEKKEKRLRKAGAGEQAKASRYLEDPDIEDEVKFLSRGGLRNQSDTLRFSRLVVRAKLPQTRLNLLKILRNAELPCRRLFLDYHGLRLLHGWMSEDGGDMAIRLSLLEALESLPIANKTVLTDSKVYQTVRNWCGNALPPNSVPTGSSASPSDESSKESTSSNSQPELATTGEEVPSELQKLALKLTSAWNSLPEIFRIPKRERIEQMKEHEREADRQFAESSLDTNRSMISDRYQRDRFGRGPTTSRYSKPSFSKDSRNHNITVVGSMTVSDPRRRSAQDSNGNNEGMKHLSKEQRREMFAAKVARDEAEKRLAEERREFETKCRFFGLDPKKTRTQDVPFCVDPSTGQWYSVARQPIPTPPCYAHIQVQPKPKSTDPDDYKLPAAVATLPRQWKYAITTLGQIYYYHAKHRIPQWHPPTPEQFRAAAEEADSSDSESCEEAKIVNESSEEDDVLIGMDEAQLRAFIDKKVEKRRHKRYSRLVDERPISPRKEEDRIYNQIEMRKYKENKEKIRKRKEEIRRRRAETLKAAALGGIDPNTLAESLNAELSTSKDKSGDGTDEPDGAIPIQDYLLSSDEEEIMKEECNNSPLLEKIVQGDKIVDELDALTTKRALKRSLPPHRELNAQPGPSSATSSGSSSGGSEHKRRKSDKKDKSKKSKDTDSKYRRNKEKFRCEIAGIIVQHLKPYRKESCILGRIQSDEDFNHLARKLTHFVMVKELKYCESVGQTLVVTESVKNKSREFIKKYMAKYGGAYIKPANDPEFKDIPFTI